MTVTYTDRSILARLFDADIRRTGRVTVDARVADLIARPDGSIIDLYSENRYLHADLNWIEQVARAVADFGGDDE